MTTTTQPPPVSNTKTRALAEWRSDIRWRAYGLLAYHGGRCSARHLAALLGVPSRGLRPLLERDCNFRMEQRVERGSDGRMHGRLWVSINESARMIEAPPPLALTYDSEEDDE